MMKLSARIDGRRRRPIHGYGNDSRLLLVKLNDGYLAFPGQRSGEHSRAATSERGERTNIPERPELGVLRETDEAARFDR